MLDPVPFRLPVAPPLQPELEFGELIGEVVAAIACLILQSLDEYKHDTQMGAQTKRDGGTLIAGFLDLRAAFGEELVNRLAREHGVRMLRERSDGAVSATASDRLVAEVITIADRIARLQLS
jgi:hypothetical protein